MTETASSTDRRAQIAAIVGLIFQIALFGILIGVGLAWDSGSMTAIARWMLGGVIIWPIIALVYRQRQRTSEEKLESAELKRVQQSGQSAAIFDVEDEAFLVEKRRLEWLLRWLVPGGAVVLALYHIIGTFVLWSWRFGAGLSELPAATAANRGQAMVVVGGAGFLAFLYSRYIAGMARQPGWRLLRAGASYLAGNALACLFVLAAMALQDTELPKPEAIATYLVRIAMLVLGIEFLVNYGLDFYRPRAAGQISRPAFDSRLLALISEPGGIARSIADAINYQFGFEVSSTWFYQLLKRALLPMTAFGLLALIILSSVVIVDADERVFVERFGRLVQPPDQPLSPGLHFKWPWPIDAVQRARVEQIRSLTIGQAASEEATEKVEGRERLKAILWGEEHKFNTEMMLVVASPELTRFDSVDAGAGERRGKAVAVGLLMVSVDIQYTVHDLYNYLYRYRDPERLVEAIAYQVLSDYAAGVNIDEFLGPGRTTINVRLHDILQRRMDELKSGISIKFVGLQEAHPEAETAKAFQEVVKAEREKENVIANARNKAGVILTGVAGSAWQATALDEAIRAMDAADRNPDSSEEDKASARDRVDELLVANAALGGEAAQRILGKKSEALEMVTDARRELALFEAEVAGYTAAPQLYKLRKYLEVLMDQHVKDSRKFVVVAHPDKRVIIELEKEERGTLEIEPAPK